MVNFILKHKKLKGAITIFMVIAYLGFYVFTGALVDGSRIRMAKTNVEDLQQLVNDNILSQYDRALYEHYGLMGVLNPSEEAIKQDLIKQISYLDGAIPEGVIESNIEEIGDIDPKSVFEPYSFNIEKINIDHLDLSNIEVLRSQIRDNMRYKAPAMLSKDFLDSIDSKIQLISMIVALSKSLKIFIKYGVEKLSRDILKKPSAICEDYFDTILETYNEKGILDGISDFVFDFLENLVKVLSVTNPLLIVVNVCKPFGLQFNDETIKDVKLANSYGKVVERVNANDDENRSKEKLYRICTEFDKKSTWPKQKNSDDDDDDDDETLLEKIQRVADKKQKDACKDIDRIIGKDEKTGLKKIKNDADLQVSSIQKYQDILKDEVLREFNTLYDEEPKTSKGKMLYKSFIEWFLIEWTKLEVNKKTSENMSKKIDNMIIQMENIKSAVVDVCDDLRENGYDGATSYPEDKLRDVVENYFVAFHEDVKDINEELIPKYLEKVQQKIGLDTFVETVKVLISLKDYNLKAIGELLKEDGSRSTFGMISYHMNRDYVDKGERKGLWDKITDYAKWTVEIAENWIDDVEEKIATATTLIVAFAEGGFAKVLDSIVDEVLEALKDTIQEADENMNDCMYIMANCRDYAHTFCGKYLLDSKFAEKLEDDIFNEKFISGKEENRDLNYLLPDEYKEHQITPAEIEYILFGREDSYKNVEEMYKKIFNMRLVLNYISALVSPVALKQNAELAASSGFITFIFIPLIYAVPKSIIELKDIMIDSKKPYVFNGGLTLKLQDGLLDIVKDLEGDAKNILINKISSSVKKGFDESKTNALKDLSNQLASLEEDTGDILDSLSIDDYDLVIQKSYNIVKNIDIKSSDEETVKDITKKISKQVSKGLTTTKGVEESISAVVEEFKRNPDMINAAVEAGSDISIDTSDRSDSSGDSDSSSSTDSTKKTFSVKGFIVNAVKDYFSHYIHEKGGYTYYLQTFLTVQGLSEDNAMNNKNNKGKNLQISRLQDIITMNMKTYNEDFDLKNAYSEMSIASNYSMKYIFMTQSWFKAANLDFDGNRYKFKINTASAY